MDVQALFGLSVLMSFVAFGIVTKLYIWPRLERMDREDALRALVVPHMFRFVGLSFLVPGVVSPSLSSAFAAPAAYGDLIAAILAMIAVGALTARAAWAVAAVWVFNVEGAVDLLNAFYQGMIATPDRAGLGALGAAFYIPTLIVPPLFVTHGLIFWLLAHPRR
jgi:hypothetical protein